MFMVLSRLLKQKSVNLILKLYSGNQAVFLKLCMFWLMCKTLTFNYLVVIGQHLPAKFFLCLFRVKVFVLHYRLEVVPLFYRECFKCTICTLSKDVIGCVFSYSPLSYTFKPETVIKTCKRWHEQLNIDIHVYYNMLTANYYRLKKKTFPNVLIINERVVLLCMPYFYSYHSSLLNI